MNPELSNLLIRTTGRKEAPSRMSSNGSSPSGQNDSKKSPVLEGDAGEQSDVSVVPVLDLTVATASGKRGAATLPSPDDNEDDRDSKSRKKSRVGKGMISRPRKPKDMPRRPLSAYNIFFRSERAKMLQSSMDAVSAGKSPSVNLGFDRLAKTIGKKWKAISESELAACKAESDNDMRRYKREMQEYHLNLAKTRRAGTAFDPDEEHDYSPPPAQVQTTLNQHQSIPAPSFLSDLHEELRNAPSRESALMPGTSLGMSRFTVDAEQRSAGLMHELDTIRKQAWLLGQHARSSLPPMGGADSFLYDQLLASEILRQQQAIVDAGDLRLAAAVNPSYGSAQSLLTRSHMQSAAAAAAAPSYGDALALFARSQLRSPPLSSSPWDRQLLLRQHLQDLPSLPPPGLVGAAASGPAPYFDSSLYRSMAALEAQQRIMDSLRETRQDGSVPDDAASSRSAAAGRRGNNTKGNWEAR